MPPRRQPWLLYAALLAAALAFWRAAAWSRAEHERARAEEARLRAAAYHPAYSKIKKGMTAAEVEALFGRGPDQAFLEGPTATRRWDVEDRWFGVFFDADGRVTDKFFKLTTPGPDNERIEGVGSADD